MLPCQEKALTMQLRGLGEMKFVPAELHKKAELYEQRNALYGDNYKRFGPILSLILAGQRLDTADAQQMNRLGTLVQIIAKVTRYGENFTRGGHEDSLDDIAVYSMMLKELDATATQDTTKQFCKNCHLEETDANIQSCPHVNCEHKG